MIFKGLSVKQITQLFFWRWESNFKHDIKKHFLKKLSETEADIYS